MKKLFSKMSFLTLLLLTTSSVFAQKAPSQKQEVENRSYAYGAMISKGIASIGLSADERNADKFVEGFKKGLSCDSLTFANAQAALQARLAGAPAGNVKEEQNFAYILGVNVIGNFGVELQLPATDFNLKAVKEGFVAAESKQTLKYTDAQMDSILRIYFEPKNEAYQSKIQAKNELKAAKTIQDGKDFLAQNAKKEGVITMENGMQYEIIKEGTGKKPTVADEVNTHYHGTLIDGSVFDSSVDRGEPISFPLSNVIRGWQEGIPLMSVGAKYRFYIPQDLAYGMQSPSPSIPAGSTLIFEVELLGIGKKEDQTALNVIEKGEQFLEENSKKEGVITLPSGLQYLVIVPSSGAKPSLTDRVKVHYHGTLIDGTVFDSSVERGQPATFPVNGVIRGWQEGIPLMSVGAKYRLFIPQGLAYGTRSQGKIPGGSVLIFDVELFEINP